MERYHEDYTVVYFAMTCKITVGLLALIQAPYQTSMVKGELIPTPPPPPPHLDLADYLSFSTHRQNDMMDKERVLFVGCLGSV